MEPMLSDLVVDPNLSQEPTSNFFRQGKRGPERFPDLPRDTQTVEEQSWIRRVSGKQEANAKQQGQRLPFLGPGSSLHFQAG